MRKELLDRLYLLLRDSGLFKSGYKNYIPPVSVPKNLPAFAISFDKEKREQANVTGCTYEHQLDFTLILYQKNHTKDFEDYLSSILEQVVDLIENDDELHSKVIDIWVTNIQTDGGILHPYYLAELDIRAIYRK